MNRMPHAVLQTRATALAASAARPRAFRLATLRRVRLVVQVLTLVLVLAPLWWPRVFPGAAVYQGNYAASRLHLGGWSIPMSDPFTALCAMFGSRSAPGTLLLGAGIILALYVPVRGRAFCAFACPIHLVLELWDKALVTLRRRCEPIGERAPAGLNVGLAILLAAASAVVAMPVFEPVNPINALVRALQHLAFAGLWIVAGVMAVDAIAGRRVFCRHLCPMGGFYSAVHRAGAVAVAVNPDTCSGCRRCVEFCLAAPELAGAITRARAQRVVVPVQSAHCTLCFECAGACEQESIVLHPRWKKAGRAGRLSPQS